LLLRDITLDLKVKFLEYEPRHEDVLGSGGISRDIFFLNCF